ncbi:hypothetical protein IJF91_01995 [Candidatus Saccharibacteria bacterium]|nr:hypothetical protein [Candidatus Saccharibacteria bacterium]
MDPNNNLTPGATPVPAPEPMTPEPIAPEPLAPEPVIPNPAVDVANAAMAGATPVVTTTDLNAMDVPAEPALQMSPDPNLQTPDLQAPVLDPNVLAQEPEGPVSLAPSAGFEMPEVATVSATPNGADPNLASINDPLSQVEVGAPAPEQQPQETPINPEAPVNPEAQAPEGQQASPEDMEPLVAAAPVPGSIGSAKSYADIQREEAEKAAKVAAAQNKKIKLSKNTIIIIVIAVVALIGLGVGAFLIFGSGSSSSTPTVTTTTTSYEDTASTSTLSCKRTLSEDEYKSFGGVGGTWENVFYFADDELDGLETNINYSYANAATATQWKVALESQYQTTTTTETSGDTTEPSTDAGTSGSTSGTKTTAEMLKHSILLDGVIVTHKMEVLSEDIKDWLESDAYSDTTYGAEPNASTEDVERNLDYYKGLQNNLNYTCSVSKGGSK